MGRDRVVVVGAGPVGLLLAGELRLGGAEVVVLERLAAPATESRATTLHARTMEILDSRGLLPRLGSPPNLRRGHFAGIPLDLTLPGPFPGQWKVPQAVTEAVLQERALALGADVRRGHTVSGVHPRADGVRVTAEGPDGEVGLDARYLVACDGQDSTVRRLLGADFPGRAAERALLRADVAGIDVPDRRFQRLERGMAVAARGPDGVTRLMLHEFDGDPPRDGAPPPGFADVVDAWKRITGEDVSGGTPLWVNAFDDASAQLAHYRHGRVLFAGDAAHRQLPVGGQALNLGLQDAFNLGWKLAAAVRADGAAAAWAEQLLDSYHQERHPVGSRVLGGITAQAMLLLRGGPDIDALRQVFTELIAVEEARTDLAAAIAGLDVRYDLGDLPQVGLRVPPEALGGAAADALRAGHGVLVVPADAPGTDDRTHPADGAPGWYPGWEGRVRTAAGPVPEPVLVRPDGHAAWAGTPHGPGPQEALRRWFGEPGTG
ncbi:FAD-dependent monooxygenase [Kitasatospora phosalacinea]|uniref:FAD-dependent monooxygenase n=1 Tax=Kitasatospora phosalacinea TaxID=2065 RepID=UPI0035DB7996